MPPAARDHPDKLPVRATIAGAYRIVFGNLGMFVVLAAVPMALSFGIQTASDAIIDAFGMPARVRLMLEEPFRWILWSVFAVAWHRFALLGRRDSASPVQFRFGRREIRYLVYSAIVATPLLIARVPTMMIVHNLQQMAGWHAVGLGLIALTAIIGGIYLLLRVSFVFPSVSVERPTGFRQSWRETRGATTRIFWATFLASIPIAVVDRLLREVVLAMEPAVARLGGGYLDNLLGRWMLAATVAQLLLSFLFSAVLVSALSLTFRDRTHWRPGGN
jgi:hypothetical protein